MVDSRRVALAVPAVNSGCANRSPGYRGRRSRHPLALVVAVSSPSRVPLPEASARGHFRRWRPDRHWHRSASPPAGWPARRPRAERGRRRLGGDDAALGWPPGTAVATKVTGEPWSPADGRQWSSARPAAGPRIRVHGGMPIRSGLDVRVETLPPPWASQPTVTPVTAIAVVVGDQYDERTGQRRPATPFCPLPLTIAMALAAGGGGVMPSPPHVRELNARAAARAPKRSC